LFAALPLAELLASAASIAEYPSRSVHQSGLSFADMPLPTIVHLDADAFFVSVEQARDPSLRGKKCAVGGQQRGIIASASYEARRAGVYTPMPTVQALKICPDLILISHSGANYGQVSRQMFELCETVTPLVQRNSVDEGYLDVSPCPLHSVEEIERAMRDLQARIWKELQIPVSIGIATNKLVAQIASKLRKPRGFVVVPPGEEASFLAPLPAGKLPGVGVKTEAAIARQGIKTVSDILARSGDELEAIFGNGWREMLASAQGIDERPVETEEEEEKSYSQQETFAKDVSDYVTIERVAKGMLDELMAKVRKDGKRAKTLTVKVRYPDFSQESKGRSIVEASDVELPFYPVLTELLKSAWSRRRPLRLVSVKLSGIEEPAAQLEMFSEGDEKRRRLAAAVDQLNQWGKLSVVRHGHQLVPKPGAGGPRQGTPLR
jgi:DNA polymerase-4